jgi:hypothetical protein
VSCSEQVRRRVLGALVAAAALAVPSACGAAPNTPPGHAATVRGALQAFLHGCSLESTPLVVDQLDEPAQRTFGEAGGALEGCQAVLPLDPGGKPTDELFGEATVGEIRVRGDRAQALVRAADGPPVRARLESSPPGAWRMRPSYADRAVVRGTLHRFLDACASADGTDAVAVLTDAAEKQFLSAGDVRDGCESVLPLAAPAKAKAKKKAKKKAKTKAKHEHNKAHATAKRRTEKPDHALFADTDLRAVTVRGDHADAVLVAPDGGTAHASLERTAARTQWRIAPSPGRSGER